MKLHDPQPSSGSHKPSRRVGRGHGSGRGKTAGRGTKGQLSRAGGGMNAWFEGGQTPLHIRTPKLHGFKNRFRIEYAGVNLARLAEAAPGTLITPDVLKHDGLLRDRKTKPRPLKILGGGDAPKGVTVHAHAFTRSALAKLAAAGSTALRISWPDGNPIDEAAAAAEPAEIKARDAARADARTASKAKSRAARAGGGPKATVAADKVDEVAAAEAPEAADSGDGAAAEATDSAETTATTETADPADTGDADATEKGSES